MNRSVKRGCTAAVIVAAAIGSGMAHAAVAAADTTLYVPAASNPFSAGFGKDVRGFAGAAAPTGYALPSGANRVMKLTSVEGTTGCAADTVDPPDGNCPAWNSDYANANGISGIIDYAPGGARMNFLAAVFLDDALPADPTPDRLDFSDPGTVGHEKGRGHDFPSLSPELRQTFFVGDGRIGRGQRPEQPLQEFRVPDSATRVYFGLVDFYYSDNYGLLKVTFSVGSGTAAKVVADDSCSDLKATTTTGTPGNDVIVGTAGDDKIDGGDGNDTICGGSGNDTITGGAGVDRLLGQDGADVLNGGPGDDVLGGGAGDDRIRGSDGDDRLRGESGRDVLDGQGGADEVYGGDGKDVLSGGPGEADLCNGGEGDDQLARGAGGDNRAGCEKIESASPSSTVRRRARLRRVKKASSKASTTKRAAGTRR